MPGGCGGGAGPCKARSPRASARFSSSGDKPDTKGTCLPDISWSLFLLIGADEVAFDDAVDRKRQSEEPLKEDVSPVSICPVVLFLSSAGQIRLHMFVRYITDRKERPTHHVLCHIAYVARMSATFDGHGIRRSSLGFARGGHQCKTSAHLSEQPLPNSAHS